MKKLSSLAWVFAYICVGLSMVVDRHAGAEQRPDPEADRVRELHKELAGTRAPIQITGSSYPNCKANQVITGNMKCASIAQPQKPITFTTVLSPTARLCKDGHNEYSFVVNDGSGQPIVSINECTGKVTVAHPERMNEQAVEFWRTVQKAFPDVCAVRGK